MLRFGTNAFWNQRISPADRDIPPPTAFCLLLMTTPTHPRRLAVLGSTGQLGHAFLRHLESSAVGLGRDQIDFAHENRLEAALLAAQPDAVVNATAYNLVDLAELHRAEALAVNFAAPVVLARICRRQGWPLLHYSTDYVFGEEGLERPYGEQDRPAPMNFYGLSKLMGEQAVLGLHPGALVFRVAHLFGGPAAPNRQNLVLRFLQQARNQQPLTASQRQWLNPTCVDDIVTASLAVLRSGQHGLYHLTGDGQCTAAEYAAEILRLAGVPGVIVEPGPDQRPARRPAYSVLDNRRLQKDGFPPMPHWRDALRRYIGKLEAAQSTA